jgi:uncharacterized protein (DUF2267 family)
MSTGLAVFDTTVQETNEWLKMVEARLPPCDRQQSYVALRAVLHVLRDRLPMEAVLGLSAQLPMLLRGLFLEGWRPVDGPSRIRDPQAFAQEVADRFPSSFQHEATGAIDAVFGVIAARLDPHEVGKIVRHLPAALRPFWPAPYRAA